MMIFEQPKVHAVQRVLETMNPTPKVLVELGGYIGKSAVAWGQMLRSFHEEASQVKVFSMELEGDFVKIIRDFVGLAGLNGTVEVIQGKSGDSLRLLKSERRIESVDVLFLDHWKDFYLPDLRLCEELGLLRVGSVIVADNTDFPGAPDYLKYVEAGGEGGWRYRCETLIVDELERSRVFAEDDQRAVHFAFVEATP